ncbi:MAG TPA: phosphate signaling complex protein PhoU [Devosiaceae bacterium]|jgi:phosphate transport system protein|nr:phosphate signaling complex protein PhoU [Devosiaceae bacterium]
MAFTLTEHTIGSYDEELTRLAETIAEMGGLVEASLSNATLALLKLDHVLARATIEADRNIDAIQKKIDEMAVSMIARRQPVAEDLRAIITAIHVANDLERMGDMAKQISRRSLQIEGLSLAPKFYNGVRHMNDLVLRQVKAALDAYATRDAAAAIQVCNGDDEVDALYTSLFRELLTYMMEDPRLITQCTHLLFAGKSLERAGDHATNIAEAAYYLETGRQLSGGVEELHRQQIHE